MSLTHRYAFRSLWKRIAASIFDAVGSFFFFFIRLRKKNFDADKIKKILVIRIDHIGDLIMTRPALELLRKAFPLAQIDWLLPEESEMLFRNETSVDHLIAFKHHWFSRNSDVNEMASSGRRILARTKQEKYDLAIDFRGDLRNILLACFAGIKWRVGYGITGGAFLLTHTQPYPHGVHQIKCNLALLELLKINGEAKLLPFTYSDEESETFLNRYAVIKNPEKKKIIVHPSAGYAEKIWPTKNFEQLIYQIIKEKLAHVVLIGTDEERRKSHFKKFSNDMIIDLRGQTKLEELPILFNHCDMFIGNDSGPAHIAACQGIPMVCIFSHMNSSEKWKPWSEQLTLIEGSISNISFSSVFHAVKDLLEKQVEHDKN